MLGGLGGGIPGMDIGVNLLGGKCSEFDTLMYRYRKTQALWCRMDSSNHMLDLFKFRSGICGHWDDGCRR
jgi:hypothetical protein